jgi:acylphosphatase
MDSKAAFHGYVAGRVQGVFFRMFVLREAQALGLGGMVRNLPDGRVEVAAEGERPKLERLVERLQAGPRGAVVSSVNVDWLEYSHDFDEFRIEYD